MEQKLGVLCGFCGEANCNIAMSKSDYACTAWDGKGNASRNLIEEGKCPSETSKCPYRYKMTKRKAKDYAGIDFK
jgi:uncharacterized low-complexity protein